MTTTTQTDKATARENLTRKWRFKWHCSYMEQCSYDAYGPGLPAGAEVETYRASQHTIDYARTIYNGTVEDFSRDFLTKLGGVAIRYPIHGRWTPEFYAAFVDHVKTKHFESLRECEEMWKRYDYTPDADTLRERYECFIPRPIYWPDDNSGWKNEPWFVETREVIAISEHATYWLDRADNYVYQLNAAGEWIGYLCSLDIWERTFSKSESTYILGGEQ